MARNYYIFKSGTLRRKGNTLYLEKDEERRILPVEDVESLYLFGQINFNSELVEFLCQKGIPVHFFGYYENYCGTLYPREYLRAGFMVVRQVEHYLNPDKRLALAREIVSGAVENVLRNLKYYHKRVKELAEVISRIEQESQDLAEINSIPELMSLEGRVHELYYSSFNLFLRPEFPFLGRERRPPTDPLNSLISFGNSLLYATTLSQIYRTQLDPTISYLHEPGARRFSLSLDLSEIFKPIIVDRTIFKLVNNRMLGEKDFDRDLNYCYLSESGRKTFVQEYEDRLNQTIEHRGLKRHVSYQRLIRLECYKLARHLVGDQPYKAFRMWW